MLDNRLKELRKERLMSLNSIAKLVGVSESTVSRYENNRVDRLNLDLIEKIADALDTSSAYLLGMTDDSHYIPEVKMPDYSTNDCLRNIYVPNDEMAPEIPEGAYIQIRDFQPDEELTAGDFYYVEFDGKKCFRMAIYHPIEGVILQPLNMKEQSISFDKEYVKFIGKAVSSKFFF